MINDLEIAKANLKGHSICFCRNGKILTDSGRGISPMMKFIAENKELKGGTVADLIVGKAAAMLFVKAGIICVYGKVMSEAGKRYLMEHKITCSYEILTERIINRKGTDICPMEKTVADIDDTEMGYEALKNAYKKVILGKEIMVGGITFPTNVLMAPLAGYTCFPFRLMAERLGAGSAYTEMVSADALKYNDNATKKLLYTDDREKIKCVQLLGGIPTVFERIVKSEILEKFDVIDINMGCPVPNVVKSGEGSALLTDLKRASKIIEACKRSGKVVSVKCRIGMNPNNIVIEEFARMCEQSGADMITVHGRTRNMMYDGEPLYEYIKKAKQVVSIPVFANGGIDSKDKALEMMLKTGADGVMLARYGFENPMIFSEITGRTCNDTKYSLLMEQMDIAEECFDELFVLTYIKKLASYFMKKLPGTKQYKMELYKCGSSKNMRKILGEIFLK